MVQRHKCRVHFGVERRLLRVLRLQLQIRLVGAVDAYGAGGGRLQMTTRVHEWQRPQIEHSCIRGKFVDGYGNNPASAGS
jgi:hypothetical protein